MIIGMHGIFHTPKADEARMFLSEILGCNHVDAGGGWLIFEIPKAELAVHPANESRHEICFWCDDIQNTVSNLKSKNVVFLSGIAEEQWGYTTRFEIPGGVHVLLYCTERF